MSGQFPADCLACRDILDHREVSKSMVKEQIGYVSAEYFVGHNLIEFPIQYILKCAMFGCFFHDSAIWIGAPNLRKQPILFHYPDYLLVIHHYFFILPQPHLYRPEAIFRFALLKQFFDYQVILIVFIFFIGRSQPAVVAASCYFGDGTSYFNI